MKQYDIVALGELLIDFTENGISNQGNVIYEANPGGAPCNVLAMASKFGNKVAFIGKVGDDNFGHMLAKTIAACNIDTRGLRFDDKVPTTLALVHNGEDGDRSFSFYRNPGADVMLCEEDLDIELIKDTKIFHFGTLSMTHSGVEQATRKAIDIAKSSGAILSFDPNLRPPLWDSLEIAKEKMTYGFSVCDILKISDDEINFYTGEEDVRLGAIKIIERFNIPLVCATLGKNGSIAFYKGMEVYCPPFINPNTIETTGAGDTFMACVLNFVLEMGIDNFNQEKLLTMLTVANKAASLITTRRGALKVMPEVDEICPVLVEI